jgi:hypothetical protein
VGDEGTVKARGAGAAGVTEVSGATGGARGDEATGEAAGVGDEGVSGAGAGVEATGAVGGVRAKGAEVACGEGAVVKSAGGGAASAKAGEAKAEARRKLTRNLRIGYPLFDMLRGRSPRRKARADDEDDKKAQKDAKTEEKRPHVSLLLSRNFLRFGDG